MKLSILILTVPDRSFLLQALMGELERQIQTEKAFDQVEIMVGPGEGSVGGKRNKLMDAAQGEFVVFIDDDDWIADDYVYQILTAAGTDCQTVGFRALMSVGGGSPRQVIYSLQNEAQVEVGGTYFRLPGHLTPIRKACLSGVRFGDKNLGEDSDFSSQIFRERRLQKEFFVDKVLYHYRFNASVSLTQQGRNPPAPQGRDLGRFDIVILSQQPDNLRGCLDSIIKNEPTLPRDRIKVVDDGSREYCEKEYPGIAWLSGQKPFIFARNANIGIRACPEGVILLNDDARLETRYGFSSLAWATRDRDGFGLSSASIKGFVGNKNQETYSRKPQFRIDTRTLAFIAVYLPKSTLEKTGLLDEDFVGYGFEDNWKCLQVRHAGLLTPIYDGCVVEHNSKENKSTFRVKPEIDMLMAQNKKIYIEKEKQLLGVK